MENRVKLFSVDSWVFTTPTSDFVTPPVPANAFQSIPETAAFVFAQLTTFRAKSCFAWIEDDRVLYVTTRSYVVMSRQIISDAMKRQALDVFLSKGGSNV